MDLIDRQLADLSPDRLDRLVRQLQARRGGDRPRGISPRPRDSAAYPLSFAQERLWFLDRLEPGSATYNIAARVTLVGNLDPDALAASLAAVVGRHEILRSRFTALDGAPVQIPAAAVAIEVPRVDLSALTADRRAAEGGRIGRAAARLPFDLGRAPLLRALLLRRGGAEHELVLVLHHIVADGWSCGVLVAEVAAFYRVARAAWAGGPVSLPALPVQYLDFAAWQRQALVGETRERLLAHWRQALAGAPARLDLPADRLPGRQAGENAARGGRLPVVIAGGAAARLRALAGEGQTTAFVVLLAAFAAWLLRLTGEDDLVIAEPFANRNRSEIEGLIGFFVNTLPLRIDAGGDPSFGELVARAGAVTAAAAAHQELPFEQLVEALRPERSLTRAPLAQVMLSLQAAPPVRALGEVELGWQGLDTGTAKLDLLAELAETAEGFAGAFEYRRDRFDRQTVARWAGHLANLVAGAVAAPQRRLSELPLLGAAERWQLLAEWNEVAGENPLAPTLHRGCEEQAARRPEAVAVVGVAAGTAHLSYGELERRANRLAHRLRELGVGPESLIGVCQPRAPELVVSLLAVLKAGGAYLPLDPAYPAERTAAILADSAAQRVLTESDLAALAPMPPIPRQEVGSPEVAVPAEALAYVIYTSGSTGRPKGVAITHRSAVRLVAWASTAFAPAELAAVVAATSICFDLSVFELFVPLSLGGTVVLADNALALPALAAQCQPTLINTVPSVMAELLECGGFPASLKTVNLAGEVLPGALAARIHAVSGVARVLNLYGPSEDTTYSTWAPVAESGLAEPAIGRPVVPTRAYVLDRWGSPLPMGATGELCLGGEKLARGYWRRPDLTAERFVPDPLSGVAGGRLYRTGDLARQRPDGNLDFLGRADRQVKLRGVRIELGEIEAALLRQPGVREAAVELRDEPGVGGFLVAYVAGTEAAPLAIPALRLALAGILPAAMIPTAWMELAALPRSPNGKLDRQRLPRPRHAPVAAAFAAPRTPTEEVLAAIWAELLGVERVGRDDDFFALGGHSLLVLRVLSRAGEALGVELPARALFQAPVLAALAAVADAARQEDAAGEAAAGPRRRPAGGGEPLPLSPAQERLWFLDRLEPGNPAFNIPAALRLRGQLDAAALGRGVDRLVARHEALRTALVASADGALQRVLPRLAVALPLADLTALPQAARSLALARLQEDEAQWRFDLSRPPLLRLRLVRLEREEHVLLLTVHHAVADGWSMRLLARDLAAFYEAEAGGAPAALPALPILPIQYPDFALWQRRWLSSAACQTQLAYWRQRLGGDLPVLDLPLDRLRPVRQTYRAGRRSQALGPERLAPLAALARGERSTLFMVLLAALDLLLARCSGQDEILVGAPIAGRVREETRDLVGVFLNSLALRTDLSGNPSFRHLLRRVRATALGAYAHQDIPFETLLADLQPSRDPSRSPVFQVMLNQLSFPRVPLALPALAVEELPTHDPGAKLDLTVYVQESDSELRLEWLFNADLFAPGRVAEMAAQLDLLLAQAVAQPDLPLDGFSLVTARAAGRLPDPREVLGATWDGPVDARVLAVARRDPGRTALRDRDGEMTYGDLDRASGRLAQALRRGGIAPGDLVAIHGHRSAPLAVAVLGILRAGAAFLIFDPAYPAARLAAAAGLARPQGWIELAAAPPVPAAVAAAVTPTAKVRLTLDRLPALLAAGAAAGAGDAAEYAGEVAVGPDDAAYVAFTSGTTGSAGTPRGILGTHGPLAHFLRWHGDTFGFTADDRFSLLSGLAHDPLLRDLFTPLTVGATLVIPDPDRLAEPGWLAAWLAREGITVAHLTPALGQLLAERSGAPAAGPAPRLRWAFFGGDRLTRGDVGRLAGEFPGVSCVNFYGTTETPQAMGWYAVPTAEPATPGGDGGDGGDRGDRGAGGRRQGVPIGRGIDEVQLLVTRPGGQLAGIGELGEIRVRTAHLARGYLGEEELTRERFVADPADPADPADAAVRTYRTGDLGRYRLDGDVEFCGRADGQCSVRGYRVELGEIESALARHPAVAAAAVLALPAAPGDPADGPDGLRLVAYVAQAAPAAGPVSPDELRRAVAERLPAYMVPAAFVVLPALPLTPNGKVDRRALPPPPPAAAAAFEAPRGAIEERMAALWRDVLGVERVGARDSFFDLGGHSLLATRLAARIQQDFGVEVPLRELLAEPTVAGIAARLAGRREEPAAAGPLPPLVPAPAERHLPFALTDIQQAYWVGRGGGGIEPGGVASHRYLEIDSDVLDVARVAAVCRRLIERHDMLRAVVLPDGRQQILAAVPPYVIGVVDLSAAPPAECAVQLAALRRRMSHQILDVTRWPLFEIRAARLPAGRIRLFLSFDYLIADAWSFHILVREMLALYRRPERALPPIELSFRDYVTAQLALRETDSFRRALAYWRGRLEDFPAGPELPLVQAPGGVAGQRFARRGATLAPELWRRLKERGRRSGLSASGILVAAFAAVLAAWSKSPRFSLVLTLFRRLPVHPQVDALVGDFTSTTLLAVDHRDGACFEARARRIQEQLWSDLDHSLVSGVEVVREMGRLRGRATRVATPVVFTSTLDLPGLAGAGEDAALPGEIVYGLSQTPQVLLDHQASERGGALIVTWDAVEAAFPAGLLTDMFAVYRQALERLAGDEDAWQAFALVELPAAQRAQCAAVNATSVPEPAGLLHAPFVAQAERQPERPAVITPGRTVSYGELLQRSRRLARRLRELGAVPNTLVAVVMEKGWEQVAAVLAILQAGAAYLPLDPALPAERLSALLARGGVAVALTQARLAAALAWPAGVVALAIDGEAGEAGEAAGGGEEPALAPLQTPSDLAYVLFTSGSTGLPKGVMIDHRGALNTIADINRRFALGPEDRVLGLSALHFDLSVWDIFGLLAVGGAVVLPDAGSLREPAHWLALLDRERVTVWNTVPALLDMLVGYAGGLGARLPGSLRLALLSGDWIPVTLPGRLHAVGEAVEVVSLGGATEASIWSIGFPVARVDPAWSSIPYGKPLANQRFYVLNEALEPCPFWVPGELYIAGLGLAHGYWRDEAKTAASFFTHPRTGERLYRTGDLGRWLPDGNIEFLGREDLQVKIQGFRVELGEIEAALAQHEGVESALAAALGERGDRQLAGYVVRRSAGLTGEELRAFLRAKLPEYMVPAAWVFLDAFPLTANGKVDRRALPAPNALRPRAQDEFAAPRTVVEEQLARLLAEALGIERMGIHDDFFTLGGNSVSAILVLSRIRRELGVELPLQDVLRAPNVAAIGEAIVKLQMDALAGDDMEALLAELETLSDDEARQVVDEWGKG